MRLTICLTAAIVLCASSTQVVAKSTFQINSTSWKFIQKGQSLRMSVDANGNYIENTATGKHKDHGTVVMKGDKVCFTSAMNSEGEDCWTTRPVSVGHSMMTKSDKGEKLTVTRIKYHPLSMPK